MTCSRYSAEVDISREREDDFAFSFTESKMSHFVIVLRGSDNRNAIEKVCCEDRYHNVETLWYLCHCERGRRKLVTGAQAAKVTAGCGDKGSVDVIA